MIILNQVSMAAANFIGETSKEPTICYLGRIQKEAIQAWAVTGGKAYMQPDKAIMDLYAENNIEQKWQINGLLVVFVDEDDFLRVGI